MNRLSKISALLFVFFLSTKMFHAQGAHHDSLYTAFFKSKNEKQRLLHLTDYCSEYKYVHPDTCLKYARDYFKNNNNSVTKDNSKLMRMLGDIYWHLGDLETSMSKYRLNLEFHRKQNNKKEICQALGDIGYIEMEQGKYPEAIVDYKESLKLAHEINDEEYIGVVGVYMAQLYDWIGEYNEALKMYHEVKPYFEKRQAKKGYGVVLMNIGAVHGNRKSIDSAMIYYKLALKHLSPEEEKSRAVVKLNIAYANLLKGHKDGEFRKVMNEAVPVLKRLNSKSNLALTDYYEGVYYMERREFNKAKAFILKAIEHYQSENNFSRLSLLYEKLSILYFEQHKPDSAFFSHKLFKQYSDSVLIGMSMNSTNYQKVMFQTDKKQLEIEGLEQKQMIQKEQLKSEKTQRFAMYGGLVLLIIFGLFMFNRFKVTQQQKKIIEQKEKETQKQNEIITVQKHLVEEKHKEITDSINYAERIQRAQLANNKILNENLNDYFILFKPKDIVSGDFYWASKLSNGNFALVVADSTGHGVPGAIMSIVNMASLKEAVIQGISSPDLLLNETRRLVIENLKNDGSSEGGKDGMDGSLLSFDFKNNMLYCSSANNPVWVIRGKELIEIKADRMPIGKHDKDKIQFTLHTINLQKADVVYTLTDGFPDQFGGENGKKFKSKHLQELLLSIAQEPMEVQKQKLDAAFYNWKGNLEQVDDVTVVGVRI